MPPSIAAKLSENDTACTEDSTDDNVTEKREEFDALFDLKDPREVHKSLNKKVEEEINEGTNTQLPFAHVQSSRLLLLKLRSGIPNL
jgi:hypothetical protein